MEHFWRNTVFTLIVISKYQTSVLDFKDVNTFSFRRHPFKGDKQSSPGKAAIS